MTHPNSGFEEPQYSAGALQQSLEGTEARLASSGLTWENFVNEAGQDLFQKGMDSFFFGLGDELDKQLQDRAFEASAAIDKLREQSKESGRWSGGHKLHVIELLLRFQDLADHHELESPTARHHLQRQDAVDGLARMIEKVIDPDNKEE